MMRLRGLIAKIKGEAVHFCNPLETSDNNSACGVRARGMLRAQHRSTKL